MATSLRPRHVRLHMRFEGLPGEFSQHDFGQEKVRFLDGSCRTVHFFASRLKRSRWVEVTLAENEVIEKLVRELAEHFSRFEGVPLCAVFDRPKTVALIWRKYGEVSGWNPTFSYAALELGFTPELRCAFPSNSAPGLAPKRRQIVGLTANHKSHGHRRARKAISRISIGLTSRSSIFTPQDVLNPLSSTPSLPSP
jgi:hypothetical protein